MQDAPQLREQLRSLSIPRDQRPGAAARRRGGWLTLLLLLAVLGLGGYVASQKVDVRGLVARPAADGAGIQLLTVTPRTAPSATPVLTATGKIVSDHQVEVQTKVSGQIVALDFEQGDRVAEGQVLARIEDVLPRARRDEAAANLERARANLAFQEVNLQWIERLATAQQASDIQLADGRRARDEARAAVQAAEATLAFAEKVLRDCEVIAPIAGVVLARHVEVGDFVAAEGGRGAMANAQFASVADMTKLRVEVDVSELDVSRLRTDMPCVITPDAYKDRRYHGFVLWIDPGANYAKATVQVKVRILEPDDRLRVEGAAQVQFLHEPPQTQEAAPAIWIPVTALLDEGPRATPQPSESARPDAGGAGRVWVVDNGRFAERPVTLGRRDGESVEVRSGLSAGEQIATQGVERIRAGEAAPR